jgi:hypothetical protein
MATAFLVQPYELLRSTVLVYRGSGLMGTVSATSRRSPLRSFLESKANRGRWLKGDRNELATRYSAISFHFAALSAFSALLGVFRIASLVIKSIISI